MISQPALIDEYYQMLLEKNSHYEGIFFVGGQDNRCFLSTDLSSEKA